MEHKIADAGPNPVRVHPHILTPVKSKLVKDGRLVQLSLGNAQWLHLSDENPDRVQERLGILQDLWGEYTAPAVVRRTGQALEIAIFRALVAADGVTPLGGFINLDGHDDSRLCQKEELQNLNGRSLGRRSLDFIVALPPDYGGIEAKNVRQWLYPHDSEVKAALQKALTLDVVPILIARRIPFVTFRLLSTCGVVLHETYNQRMANADAALADRVKDKNLLGYHDVRVGNEPDARMTKFIGTNLPAVMAQSRERLAQYRDLLSAYASDEMPYDEFAARVRRRQLGQNEDNDWPERPDDEDRDPRD